MLPFCGRGLYAPLPVYRRVSRDRCRAQAALLPAFQFLRRQWGEEREADVDFALERSRSAMTAGVFNRHQPRHRFGTEGNDDGFATAGFFDQARELGLALWMVMVSMIS